MFLTEPYTPARWNIVMSTLKPKRVLLIGWDAADWQMIDPLIEQGHMPNLKRFVDEGVRGNIATLTPPLSPMLWTSIATGKTADKHGILGFAEPDGVSGKSRPVTSTGRTCKAIWNILSEADKPAGAINWFASHPAEPINGFVVTDRFAHPTGLLDPDEPDLGWKKVPGSVWPSEDLEPLASVRIHPQMIAQDQVMEFIPSAITDESAQWEKVRELRVLLAHCATVHNAATAYIEDREWSFLGIYYDAIDRFAHAFMEFNRPQMPHVSDQEFERYHTVMEMCYRYHDLMLGRLMNMIDDETAVILLSDHGFHSGVTRPQGTSGIIDGQPAAWHRHYGIVGFWGPGIAKGKQVYGATLLDITPTILDMFDMPIARDMDGLPLMQIWDEPRLISQWVDSYERDDQPSESIGQVSDAVVDEQIMHQLRQLGYVGADDAQAVTIDRTRNLAAVYQSQGKAREAIEEYKRILKLDPETKGIQLAIAGCLLSLGHSDEALEMLTQAESETPTPNARHATLRSMICSHIGQHQEALESIDHAINIDDSIPGVYARRGQILCRLEQWDDAERAFELALERDPDDADAHEGIGRVYHKTDRHVESVLALTRSIALLRHRGSTHLLLGDALVQVERFAWAIQAYSDSARLSPRDPTPHDRLGELYERVMKNEAKAGFHQRRAAMIREARNNAKQPDRVQIDAQPRNKHRQTQRPSAISDRGHGSSTPITVVSGLPRSGTSLMMQMLYAGGLPILQDELRTADENNPRGYFEYEPVKHSAIDSSWVEHAPGHAVKVIHALLRVLPETYRYRVIFMKRSLEEVVTSQSAMLEQMGNEGAEITASMLRDAYAREYERIGSWLSSKPNFEVLEVSYNTLIADPEQEISRIMAFLHTQTDAAAMQSVIDQSLYRQRNQH
jgi:predicted AlkP superfamily phosphohydrolase/phosphomutase/tetratricopeptide (TPR) repeat protein